MKLKRKITNFLIVGSKDKFTLDYIYFNTLKHLGYEVDFLNIEKSINHRIVAGIKKYFSGINHSILRKKIINSFFFKKKKYSVIIFFKSIYLNKFTLKKIKNLNGEAFYVNIFPDDPLDTKNSVISNKNFIDCISEFDLFCIWSKKILKKLKKKFKSNILYLPFGYDSLNINKMIKKKLKLKNQIFFLGTYEKERFVTLNSIIEKKKIYGGNWSRFREKKIRNSVISNHIYGQKIYNLMNSSAITLNILRKQNLSSHNMKTFEIPAYNGLMLTTRSKEQNTFFKENISCFMYSTKKELNKKIRFIFKNPKIAKKVRNSGNIKVKNHNYINRVKYLIKELKKIKND